MTTLEEARSVVSRLNLEDRLHLMDWLSRESVEVAPGIFRTPGVCGGEACIGRMRLPVWLLEEGRRNGSSDSQLLHGHSGLTRDDLKSAWTYVASHLEEIKDLTIARVSPKVDAIILAGRCGLGVWVVDQIISTGLQRVVSSPQFRAADSLALQKHPRINAEYVVD